MLQTSTEVVLTKRNIKKKPYQYIIFNDMVKRNQYFEDIGRIKDRSEKSTPDMQQVIRADIERMKSNKFYDRQLNRNLNGPNGLTWQCKKKLQRLRSDERGVERDLIRLNRDLAKISSLHSIGRSPLLSRKQTSRLESIIEENSSIVSIEKSELILERSSAINPNRPSWNHLIPSKKASSVIKTNPHNEQSYSLPKYSFQQVIAKTGNDRSYLQQPTHIINLQKRLAEQKFKQFLH